MVVNYDMFVNVYISVTTRTDWKNKMCYTFEDFIYCSTDNDFTK